MAAAGSQSVRFPCPHCGRILAAGEILRGTEQLCPHCRKLVPVPAKSDQVEDPPPIQLENPADRMTSPSVPHPPPVAQPNLATNVENEDEMWAPGEAAPAEQPAYVPVHCRVCDTRMYATTDQVGSELACPDCGAKTQVKMVAKKSLAAAPQVMPGEDYELSEPPPALTLDKLGYGSRETPRLHSGDDADSLAATARADQAIRRARRSPSKYWMLRGVFQYPLRVSVWSNALLIASLGAAVIYVTAWVNFLSGIQFAAMLSVFMVVVVAALAIFASGYLGALLVAVIEVASDGQEEIEDELELQFADRVFRFLFVVSAWVCAAAPGMLIDVFAGAPAAWQLSGPLDMSLFSLISLFVCLPWTQLSVLEASSLVVPISYQVLSSARRKPLAWLAFYGVSTVIVATAVGLMLLVSYLFSFVGLWLALWIAVIALVIYYRLLGRLAWYCAAYTDPLEERKSADPYRPLYP